MKLYRLPAFMLALLLVSAVVAQDTGEDDADNLSAASETRDTVTVSKTDKSAASADDGEQQGRPVNASTDVFVPTEEVSVDKPISMPVDI